MRRGDDAVLRLSRRMLASGSRSFAAASRLFDRRTRAGVQMLYAWCRYCDDEIDGQHLGSSAVQDAGGRASRLQSLYRRTARALEGGTTDDPVFAALQRVVEGYGIPKRYPMELLAGFAMDVERRRPKSLEDTLRYCYHVAGVVGIMMAYVLGVRAPATLRRAADLGIAFQLTNIARDVMDDAAGGRCYLPAEWLAASGLEAPDVARPEHRDAVASVVTRLLDEADRYYASARAGLPALGFRAAWAVGTAQRVYRAIGQLVRSRAAGAWDRRAVVGTSRKLVAVVAAGAEACALRFPHRPPPGPRSGIPTGPGPDGGGDPT